MWSTKGIDPSIGPETTTKHDKERKESEAAEAIIKPTAKELTWAKPNARWLCNRHKRLDHYGMLLIQCRIKAMTKSSRIRLDRSARRTLMENQTRVGSFQDRRSTLYTLRATLTMSRRGKLAGV